MPEIVRREGKRRGGPLLVALLLGLLLVGGTVLLLLPPGTLKRLVRVAWPSSSSEIITAETRELAGQPAADEPAVEGSAEAAAPAAAEAAASETPVADKEPATPSGQAKIDEPLAMAPEPEPAEAAEPAEAQVVASPDTAATAEAAPVAEDPPITVARALPLDPSRPAAEPEADPDSLLRAPETALRKFLAAPNWKERLKHAQVPEKVRADMAEYYKTHPDGAHTPTSVTYMTSSPAPGRKYMMYLFHVTFPDLPQGFPIAVEETASGWKVDWRSFVEFKDEHLKKFLSGYQPEPASFQIKLQRTHYFDKDVPDLDQKYCFRISAPIYGHDGYAFVDRTDATVVPKLQDKLGWDAAHHVIATLQWVRTPGGHQFVALRDILSDSWRAEHDPRLGRR